MEASVDETSPERSWGAHAEGSPALTHTALQDQERMWRVCVCVCVCVGVCVWGVGGVVVCGVCVWVWARCRVVSVWWCVCARVCVCVCVYRGDLDHLEDETWTPCVNNLN